MLPAVLAALKANVDIQNAVGVTVADVVTQLVGDAAVWQGFGDALGVLVTDLADDAAVQQYAGTEVAALVTAMLADSQSSHRLPGPSVKRLAPRSSCWLPGGWGRNWARWSPRCCRPSSASRVGRPLAEAAATLAVAVVAGDIATVFPEVLASLSADVAIQAAVGATVGDVVTQLVGDSTTLVQALGDAVAGLVTDLVDDATVRQYAGTEVAAW